MKRLGFVCDSCGGQVREGVGIEIKWRMFTRLTGKARKHLEFCSWACLVEWAVHEGR